MSTPPPYATSHLSTSHGTVYFYVGAAAAMAVLYSSLRVQAAVDKQQQTAAQDLARKLIGRPDFDPITVAIIGAIIAGIGITISAASATATVANAAASWTNTARAGKPGTESLQLNIRNDTLSPVVQYAYTNGACSVGTTCRPLLPGTSASFDVLQPEGFQKGNSKVAMTFLAGAGAFDVDGVRTLLSPVQAIMAFEFTGSGDWVPAYSIDGSDVLSSSNVKGLSALYFAPNEGIDMLDLTVASYLSQRAMSNIDVLFLPGSSVVT